MKALSLALMLLCFSQAEAVTDRTVKKISFTNKHLSNKHVSSKKRKVNILRNNTITSKHNIKKREKMSMSLKQYMQKDEKISEMQLQINNLYHIIYNLFDEIMYFCVNNYSSYARAELPLFNKEWKIDIMNNILKTNILVNDRDMMNLLFECGGLCEKLFDETHERLYYNYYDNIITPSDSEDEARSNNENLSIEVMSSLLDILGYVLQNNKLSDIFVPTDAEEYLGENGSCSTNREIYGRYNHLSKEFISKIILSPDYRDIHMCMKHISFFSDIKQKLYNKQNGQIIEDIYRESDDDFNYDPDINPTYITGVINILKSHKGNINRQIEECIAEENNQNALLDQKIASFFNNLRAYANKNITYYGSVLLTLYKAKTSTEYNNFTQYFEKKNEGPLSDEDIYFYGKILSEEVTLQYENNPTIFIQTWLNSFDSMSMAKKRDFVFQLMRFDEEKVVQAATKIAEDLIITTPHNSIILNNEEKKKEILEALCGYEECVPNLIKWINNSEDIPDNVWYIHHNV